MVMAIGQLNSALDGMKARLSDIGGDAIEIEAELEKIYAAQQELPAVEAELDSVREKAEAAAAAIRSMADERRNPSKGHIQTSEGGDLVKEDGIFSDGT